MVVRVWCGKGCGEVVDGGDEGLILTVMEVIWDVKRGVVGI